MYKAFPTTLSMKLTRLLSNIFKAVKNFFYPIRFAKGDMPSMGSIYDQTFKDDEGKVINLSAYKGKKLLIVNSASKCRYTMQYDGLEKMHSKYKEKLNIIAFPCNDFGRQERGSNSEIQNFCKVNYGVTFKVFRKTNVLNASQDQIFNWLCNANLNGWNDRVPMWNFWKFLINEKGNLIAVFPSRVNPLSSKVVDLIDK